MRAVPDRLHVGGLLALATAGFVTILTEALPAGLLPQIGSALGVSEALAGQWVSVYAVGSLVAAIPLTALTRSWQRRPLLLAAVLGFALANGVTAMSENFPISLMARFVGGISAGLLWALLAGYAVRLAPERLGGRAMAIAMAGTPIVLSIGIPIGTVLGNLAGWRVVFAGLSGIAVLLAGWMALRLPDFSGEAATRRPSLSRVLTLPGVRPALLLTLCFVLAHNILYTFIAPLLAKAAIADQTDRVLLTFGVAGLISITAAGALIDQHLKRLAWAAILLFALASVLLGTSVSTFSIYTAALAWGLGFGGAATVFQTASARAAGRAADVAQAMIVTAWNLAIAGGAILGGTMLDRLGVETLPWAAFILLGTAGMTMINSKPSGKD